MSVDITEYFKKLMVSERDSDFTIVVFDEEGNKVERKAHKIILKRSPYFEGLFNVEGKEQQAGTVTLDNIPNETMTLVLNYLYTDDLDIPTKNAADVSIAADYLQLELLRDECIRNLSQNYTELTADELAASLDKVLKHKLMEPDNCEDMIEYLVCNLNHWNNLPYLSEEFLTVLIEQESNLPRQCLYWLENWTDIEHEKEQRLEKAKNLLSKLDLLQLSARDLLECSSSPLLSSSLVLELLKKKAKEEDDGDAKEYTFGFYGDYTKEFEYQGTHWIVAFYAFSVKDYTELKDKKLFEFIKGDPDAHIDVTLKSPKQKGFTWNLKPLEREGYLQATPAGFQAIEAMKKEKHFTLEFTVSL